jgi:hypothetical protein
MHNAENIFETSGPAETIAHLRFTVPAVDGSRREIFRGTGTKEIAAAKRIAAQIIESFWNGVE